jgi:hypothetical protein
MRQLQLFTSAELAQMRDRTASRNYSPERDEFRRQHERHRAWGLARRHTIKASRARAAADREPSAASPPLSDASASGSGRDVGRPASPEVRAGTDSSGDLTSDNGGSDQLSQATAGSEPAAEGAGSSPRHRLVEAPATERRGEVAQSGKKHVDRGETVSRNGAAGCTRRSCAAPMMNARGAMKAVSLCLSETPRVPP